jgi:dTDP-4-dehydrorhamnose 3,5-epimerase
MRVEEAPLPGVRVIHPIRYDDERGWFAEIWNADRYRDAGLHMRFVQTNTSYSTRGVLRGLHFQWPAPQDKLISVLAGAVFDVAVDVRPASPTFGHWYGLELSTDNRRQLWVPGGLAHGFLVLSDHALVHYQCTAPYDAASDRSIAWDDPGIGIEWPERPTVISDKDRAAPRLRDLAVAELPT